MHAEYFYAQPPPIFFSFFFNLKHFRCKLAHVFQIRVENSVDPEQMALSVFSNTVKTSKIQTDFSKYSLIRNKFWTH